MQYVYACNPSSRVAKNGVAVLGIKTLHRNCMLSRVGTNGTVAVCRSLGLSGLSYAITVVGGTHDGGVNGGSVVGIRYPIRGLSLSVLNFVSRGVAMGMVGSRGVITGGRLGLPGRIIGIVGYGGPHYVASVRRKLSRVFILTSGRGRICEYGCYRRGCANGHGGWWGACRGGEARRVHSIFLCTVEPVDQIVSLNGRLSEPCITVELGQPA